MFSFLLLSAFLFGFTGLMTPEERYREAAAVPNPG
jgi:hypothetical protein